jgi:acyl carrier protein
MGVEQDLENYLVAELRDGGEFEASKLGADDNLISLGFLDSLLVLKLATFMEETFGIAIGDGDITASNFESIAQMAALVERKRQG